MWMVQSVLAMGMHRPGMDAKMDSLHTLPMLPIEVHVEVSDIELGEFPFQSRRFDAEIAQRADGHIAADAGGTVEEQDTHGKKRGLKGMRSTSSQFAELNGFVVKRFADDAAVKSVHRTESSHVFCT